MPEIPPGGYLFRLQDVEKQRERRKTKAKKGRKKKEEKTWKHEAPTNLCFFCPLFTIKLGKMKFLDKRYPPDIHIYIYIYTYIYIYIASLSSLDAGKGEASATLATDRNRASSTLSFCSVLEGGDIPIWEVLHLSLLGLTSEHTKKIIEPHP